LVLSACPNNTLSTLRLLPLERPTILLLKWVDRRAHGTYSTSPLRALLHLLSGIVSLVQLFTDQPLKLAVFLALLYASRVLVYGTLPRIVVQGGGLCCPPHPSLVVLACQHGGRRAILSPDSASHGFLLELLYGGHIRLVPCQVREYNVMRL
jgi:hypothetical protein